MYSGQASSKGHRVERIIPAKGGRNHVLWLISDLLKQPRLPKAAFTDLKAMLEGGLFSIKKRSLVFVVSDFISTPGWGKALAQLAQRHETLAVRLYDPLEMALPDLGLLILQDAESGEQIFVDTHDKGFRRRFAAAAERREAALRADFTQAGVDVLELSTEDDLVSALLRFADLRKQRSRLAAGATLPAHLGQAARPGVPARSAPGQPFPQARSPHPAQGRPP
jgi:uncharacterized protein (DUF58 family)